MPLSLTTIARSGDKRRFLVIGKSVEIIRRNYVIASAQICDERTEVIFEWHIVERDKSAILTVGQT